ncbi:MAG: NAD(P)-dependent oxidoreductase [Anaerolineae bacterium]|nr:NAD(P)-dependent oxidoreductase [Phycisphaerae bacterium]
MSSLAFIGLGIMGKPMAGHLLGGGNKLVVHSRTKSKADDLLKRGATWAESPMAAAKGADVIFVCVTDTPDAQEVIMGARGIVQSAKPGAIVIDHSTISPTATREMAEALAKKKVTLLDAPVSGGDVGARDATLSIMVGGDESSLTRVEPLLKRIGKNIAHCGPNGAGQLTKLVNQILVSVTNLAVCEAMTFAKRNGLDLAKTIEAVAGGAAGSWQLQNLGPRMAIADNKPGFMVDLQQKDLRLILQRAETENLSLPATSLVHQLFSAAQAAGHGKDGTQSLFTVLEKLAALH